MIRFSISNVAFQEGTADALYRLLLGVCADITITIDGRDFVSEPCYPVAELARQMRQETPGTLNSNGSFTLTSVELEEPEFIRFERAQPDGYVISSPFQKWVYEKSIPRLDVVVAFQRFTGDVLVESSSALNLDLRQAIFE